MLHFTGSDTYTPRVICHSTYINFFNITFEEELRTLGGGNPLRVMMRDETT